MKVSFYIISMKESPQLAQKENDKKIQAIKDAIMKNYKIKDEDIIISATRVNPEYTYNHDAEDPTKRKVLLGYRAQNDIIINIRNIEQYQEVIHIILGFSVDTLQAVNFITSSEEKYYHNGLVLAFEDAKHKAAALASHNGYNIKNAEVSITEYNNDGPTVYNRLAETATLSSSTYQKNYDIGEAQRNREVEIRVSVSFVIYR